MSKPVNIQTVKYQARIETPTIYTDYLVDGKKSVPMVQGNRDYKEVQLWVAEGNTPEPAYTQEELDAYAQSQAVIVPDSMAQEGGKLTIEDDARVSVGANPIIEDRDAHDAWIIKVYDNQDAGGTDVYKPPPTERQMLEIADEDRDNYTFTRFEDTWGWQWKMVLKREDITNLAVAIYDQAGNYLYTTGKLLPESPGFWYTVCPPGQADTTPKDVYYKWLLGAGDISGLQVYKGADDSTSGIVRSDERYD